MITSKEQRWAVVCFFHPASGKSFVVESTLSRTRKEAIDKFVSGCELSWRTWKKRFNYSARKVTVTIEV